MKLQNGPVQYTTLQDEVRALCDKLDEAEAQRNAERDTANGTAEQAWAALEGARKRAGDLSVELQAEREAHGAAIARAQNAEAVIERVNALTEYARSAGENVSLRGLFLALKREA